MLAARFRRETTHLPIGHLPQFHVEHAKVVIHFDIEMGNDLRSGCWPDR